MNAWEILGIEPTKDKKEIKKGNYSKPILLSNGMDDGIASFLIYANNEKKSVLAQDLGDCCDNE